MFRHWFHERARRSAYLDCEHKGRIDELGQRLLERGYSSRALANHLREWLRFACYLQGQGLPSPAQFRDPMVQGYLDLRREQVASCTGRQASTAVRIFVEADAEGRFRRRRCLPERPRPTLYQQWGPGYLEFLRQHRGLAARNIEHHAQCLTAFLGFTDQRGLSALEQLTAGDIHDFTAGLTHLKPRTRHHYGYVLRSFLRWARAQGALGLDLSAAIMKPIVYRHSALIRPLPTEAVGRLLKAVDRSQPLGKRDYAMLLLACRYGLRVGDIRRLRLEDIRWREKLICLQQAKTGRGLTLPLLDDVAEALVDYLRDGRPTSAAREIFVRHQAPHEAFGPDNNFYDVMTRCLRRAQLNPPPGQRGFHSLRHTLAVRMLAHDQSLKTIADVLGHASTESTFIYVKSDVGGLRKAALSWRGLVRPSLAAAATQTRYLYGRDDLTALREVPLRFQEVLS
jgi:site-specific recombinase XerD